MAKTDNLIPTVVLTVSTNETVKDRLERLVYTGYYGKNAAEAMERVTAQTLKALDEEGRIPSRPTTPTDGPPPRQ